MRRRTEPSLTGSRRLIAGLTLGGLAISQTMLGLWALLAPAGFYRHFPAAGHARVALLPPYNEHLVRDVGALSLSLTVLLEQPARAGQGQARLPSQPDQLLGRDLLT
jgi:hypothetical protein